MYQTNSRGADWIKVKPEYAFSDLYAARNHMMHE
jgi:hypothetical protein